MTGSDTEKFGQKLLSNDDPKAARSIKLPGTAGFDLVVTRTLDEIEIRPVQRSAIIDIAGVDRLEFVLDVLREEAIWLNSRTPGRAAIVQCHRCHDKMFTPSYKETQDYWCLDTKRKRCVLDEEGRKRR
jgi:hypothetical protein